MCGNADRRQTHARLAGVCQTVDSVHDGIIVATCQIHTSFSPSPTCQNQVLSVRPGPGMIRAQISLMLLRVLNAHGALVLLFTDVQQARTGRDPCS